MSDEIELYQIFSFISLEKSSKSFIEFVIIVYGIFKPMFTAT